jgi:hypothetical protein
MLIFSISFPNFKNNFSIYMPQNIYKGCVSVFDKYLHWPHVSVKSYLNIATG